MLATLDSKGRVTLPEKIRERLKLNAGAQLDFQLLDDNTIRVQVVQPDARRIRGLLKSPHAVAPTVEAMDAAVRRLLSQANTRATP